MPATLGYNNKSVIHYLLIIEASLNNTIKTNEYVNRSARMITS